MLELGAGWAPAVADDPTELQFFFEKNKVSTDGQNFWIGGLAYQPLESEGKTLIILLPPYEHKKVSRLNITSLWYGIRNCSIGANGLKSSSR